MRGAVAKRLRGRRVTTPVYASSPGWAPPQFAVVPHPTLLGQTVVFKTAKGEPLRLHHHCERAQYKAAKRQYKRS